MRFTLIYKGRIPSQGDSQQINTIRYDAALQEQLRSLHGVTSPTYGTTNKQIIGGVLYTAILPVAWVCSIDILFLRATPQANINGLPDIDNTLKTLFDAICAPMLPGAPHGTPIQQSCFVLALEDKQLSRITVSADHHWIGTPNDDLAIIRVTTQETPIDDSVTLGGMSFATLRTNVF